MPETCWFTLDHEPPNEGVPPARTYALNPPNSSPHGYAPIDNGPPNGGMWGPPPPRPYYPWPTGPTPYYGRPAPPTVSRPSPAPASFAGFTGMMGAFSGFAPCPTSVYSHWRGPSYEPPGQYVDGHMMHGDGWSYITPADNTTICFINNGVRPCDWPNGRCTEKFGFLQHKTPCGMTIRELMNRLGCPDGETKGLTEVRDLGGGQWVALDSFTQGGEASKQTLAQVGWTKERDEKNPVWLVVKR